MAESRMAEVLEKIQTLPPLPAAVRKLCEITESPDVTVQQIVDVIAMDASLTTRLLRLANSAFYGYSGKIATIARAVAVLGSQQIRNLALGIAIFGTRTQGSQRRPFKYESLWLHFLAVGVAARRVARRFKMGDPEEAFVGGLLHDIGKTVYMEFMPQEYDALLDKTRYHQVPLFDLEKETFGMDHMAVGEKLCAYWQVPDALTDVVSGHHMSLEESAGLDDKPRKLLSAVKVANGLVKAIGLSGNGDGRIAFEVATILNELPDSFQFCHESAFTLATEITEAQRLFEIPAVEGNRPVVTEPSGASVAVNLKDPYECLVASLVLDTMGFSVVSLARPGDRPLKAIVADEELSPDSIGTNARNLPVLNLPSWRRKYTRDGKGPIDPRRLREWFVSIVGIPSA